jgi:hypothetical protein
MVTDINDKVKKRNKRKRQFRKRSRKRQKRHEKARDEGKILKRKKDKDSVDVLFMYFVHTMYCTCCNSHENPGFHSVVKTNSRDLYVNTTNR